MSGYVRLGHVISGYFMLCKDRSGYVRFVKVSSG
jgi:hypothetical protein